MSDIKKHLKKFYDEEGFTDYQAKRYTEGNFLPMELWTYLDMLLSKIAIPRRKGHFAIFVAEKLS